MGVFENVIYWVDRGHRKLMKVNIFDTKNKTVITELSQESLTVKVAHALLQPYEENPCSRSNCEHLCLLSTSSLQGYTCACQIGYIKDSVNENRCNLDESPFLLILNQNIIGGMRIYANDSSPIDDINTGDTLISNSNDDTTLDTSYSNLVREDGSLLWDRLTPVNGINLKINISIKNI